MQISDLHNKVFNDNNKELLNTIEKLNADIIVITGDLTILLSHSPGIIEKYDNIPADLILSGHTHGGQVRFPFIGAFVAPDQGLFPEYDKGIFKLGPEQYLYIDSGLGTSVAPIRFLNQIQISLIQIVSKN